MYRTLVIILVISISCISCQMDVMQALAIKQRAQSCMASYLPAQSYGVQQQLAMCFDVNCGRSIISQVMTMYPNHVPVLRQCLGY
ncbi:unnamed protein product [Auanema sp. JU1783]|nr:unnamed protein product [Auanema sp. JU1783]